MQNVKSTIIDKLLSTIAPHLCCGCAIEGTLLCDNCKYDIISEPFNNCLSCGNLVASSMGICQSCHVSYNRAWCVGERVEALHAVIEQYKFYRARDGFKALAGLLDATLPVMPHETIIVPIPTLRTHIRRRGYDHVSLIASEFARRRNLTIRPCLTRLTTTKQLGASRSRRFEQAREAFACRTPLDVSVPYLIIDDVVTTGATIEYAARALQSAGAQDVWVAAMSRQPLKANK